MDRSLVGQLNDFISWVENFHNFAAKNNNVKALYFEINEFDINTDSWYIVCFAYNHDGGLDLEDMEWLFDFDTDSQTETETVFEISGYEELQDAFENVELATRDLQHTRDWCAQIVIARFMEFMTASHKKAHELNLNWGQIPIYFTEHAYDLIVKSDK